DLPIEFLGWRQDIAAVFEQLDLLVVPSKQEGMGRVVIEAFSAGLPVVASAAGGIPEVVKDGETGFLVRGEGPHALAARIRPALATSAQLQAIALNARRTWEAKYSLEIYRERITQIMAAQVSTASTARETQALPARR